jgi:glycosyltransferase involved in cell wall biosynthesis
MRCLIIQNRLGLEGRTRCVVEFVRLLNELGEEPEIVCLTFSDPDIGRPFGLPGLRYRISPLLPLSRVPSAYRPEVLLTNFLARGVIDRTHPDLVFNSNCTWACLPSGPRYIHYVHAPFKAMRYVPRYERGMWKSYASFLNLLVREGAPPPHSAFVANSEMIRTGIAETYSLDATVIYPPSWRGELQGGRPDLRRVVTLGSMHPDKRQLDQIEIARRLPDWHFTLLGSTAAPRYARLVQSEASRLPNVEVHLNPSRRQIEEALAAASHFLHTHPQEGFGIAAVEAIAAGCIPVVPNSGGIREIVGPEELRFVSIDGAVEALRSSAGEKGRRLLGDVQQGLHRFGADTFRSAMTRVVVAQSEAELVRGTALPLSG